MYIEKDNVSKEEDNNDSPRDVPFMDLIQDENSIGVKSSIKGAPTSTSKPSNKWTYNGTHLPSQNSKEKKKSSSTKELVKLENTVKNICPFDGITTIVKVQKFQ